MNQPLPEGLLEGWVGVDLPHEHNGVFIDFMQRYVARFGGPRPFGCYPAHMYDIGRALAEAIPGRAGHTEGCGRGTRTGSDAARFHGRPRHGAGVRPL